MQTIVDQIERAIYGERFAFLKGIPAFLGLTR